MCGWIAEKKPSKTCVWILFSTSYFLYCLLKILSPLSKEVSVPKCSIQISSSYTTAPRKKKTYPPTDPVWKPDRATSNLNPQVACLRANGIHKPLGVLLGEVWEQENSVDRPGGINHL